MMSRSQSFKRSSVSPADSSVPLIDGFCGDGEGKVRFAETRSACEKQVAAVLFEVVCVAPAEVVNVAHLLAVGTLAVYGNIGIIEQGEILKGRERQRGDTV